MESNDKRKKLLLSRLMNYTGCFSVMKQVQRENLYVLSYHRIYKQPLKTDFNHNVFNHPVDIFEKQIKWLKNNYDVFSENDLLEHLTGTKPLRRRTAIITFDDGYRDNYELAFPILQKNKLPGIMFIPYNQIDGTSVAWWDVLAYFANYATVPTVRVMNEVFNLKDEEQRKLAIIYLCWQYKILPENEAKDYLIRMHQELKVEQSIEEITHFSNKEFMNWDQVREIDKNDFTIGSHTMNHQILANQSRETQLKELTDSKRLLEEKLNREINTIAYPVGKEQHFTEETKELAKTAGYKAGFSFIKDYSKNTPKDKFSIPRFELGHSNSLFKAQTLLARVF